MAQRLLCHLIMISGAKILKVGLVALVATQVVACVEPLPLEEHEVPNEGGAPGTAEKINITIPQWAQIKRLSPLPTLPADPTNKYADDERAAVLGQRLFFDSRYSGEVPNSGIFSPGNLSCASCHVGPGMDQPRPELASSKGSPYTKKRNVLGLVNASFYTWVNWGGRFSAQWELSLAVAENANILNSDRLQIAHMMFDRYRADYQSIFGPLPADLVSTFDRFPARGKPVAMGGVNGAWEAMTDADRNAVNHIFVNYGKSIAAYLRKLVSRNSRFDAFIAGDKTALSDFEQIGLQVFVGKGQCTNCHGGPTFSDDKFHAFFEASGARVGMPDLGRREDIPPLLNSPFNSEGYFSDDRTTGRLVGLAHAGEETRSQFRTPSLRNVAITPPYMHSGSLTSLQAVVDAHNPGRRDSATDELLGTSVLNNTETEALVAFMESLTMAPVSAALLEDTSRK